LIRSGYTNHEIAQIGDKRFHIKTESLDLALEMKKPPSSNKDRVRRSLRARDRYYSLTDLTATE